MTEGACVICGEPAHTELMVPAGAGGAFAKLGKLCGRCQRDTFANAAHQARTGAPFAPIETGAKFPDGAHVTEGTCAQCAREGSIVLYMAEYPAFGRTSPKPGCAECIADLVAGVQRHAGAALYVQVPSGKFGKVGTR